MTVTTGKENQLSFDSFSEFIITSTNAHSAIDTIYKCPKIVINYSNKKGLMLIRVISAYV